MFFSGISPEALQKITELRKHQEQSKKPKPTFEEYYHKRLMEEYGEYIKNPRFDFKHMMIMSHLYKAMREKAQKEYNNM